MYISIYRFTQVRTVACYKTCLSSRQVGCPMTNKTASLVYNQNLFVTPEGGSTPRLTDRQL